MLLNHRHQLELSFWSVSLVLWCYIWSKSFSRTYTYCWQYSWSFFNQYPRELTYWHWTPSHHPLQHLMFPLYLMVSTIHSLVQSSISPRVITMDFVISFTIQTLHAKDIEYVWSYLNNLIRNSFKEFIPTVTVHAKKFPTLV